MNGLEHGHTMWKLLVLEKTAEVALEPREVFSLEPALELLEGNTYQARQVA